MATIFLTTLNPTPFGIFDAEPSFQTEADNMVTFVMRKLGESVLSVELTKKDLYMLTEEATLAFSAKLLEYQATSNLSTLLGTPTGSNINLTNVYVKQNLEFLERQAEPYADIIGYGTDQDSISGSIDLIVGQQDYDLYTDLKMADGSLVVNQQPTATKSKMKIFEVFHQAPISYIFNSNLSSNLLNSGLPVESYVPDSRFYVLPVFEDVLRAGMLETASRVRRSNFSYKITGRHIRIYPCPTAASYGQKLWLRVGFPIAVAPGLIESTASGSFFASGSIVDSKLFGISTPANIPYHVVPYGSINAWGQHWIRQYTVALSKELLGYIRSKFKSLPIPGSEISLNGEDLLNHAREDKEKLLTTLTDKLDSLTYSKLQEMEATKAEMLEKQLKFVPFPPTYSVKLF